MGLEGDRCLMIKVLKLLRLYWSTCAKIYNFFLVLKSFESGSLCNHSYPGTEYLVQNDPDLSVICLLWPLSATTPGSMVFSIDKKVANRSNIYRWMNKQVVEYIHDRTQSSYERDKVHNAWMKISLSLTLFSLSLSKTGSLYCLGTHYVV